MIRVGIGARDIVAAIQSGLDELEQVLDQLALQLDQLDEQWTGTAQEAFRVAERDWERQIRALRRVAATACSNADSSVVRFAEFDQRRAGAWRS